MYEMNFASAHTINYCARQATLPYDKPVVVGWNRIPCPYSTATAFSTAFPNHYPTIEESRTCTAAGGVIQYDEIIVSQQSSSMLTCMAGMVMWFGGLTNLQPGVGYMFRSSATGTMRYFASGGRRLEADISINETRHDAATPAVSTGSLKWIYDPSCCEHSMSMYASVTLDGVPQKGGQLAAFGAKGKVRGAAVPIPLPSSIDLPGALFAPNIGGADGEVLSFQFTTDFSTAYKCSTTVEFSTNDLLGKPNAPIMIACTAAVTSLPSSLFERIAKWRMR